MRFSETRCGQNNTVRSYDFALVGAVNAAALAEWPEVINRILPVTEHHFSKLGHGSVHAGFNLGGESHLCSFVVVAFHMCIISVLSAFVKHHRHLFGKEL
jgi:hypothetical protein